MTTVGIKALKAHLSGYLVQVRNGESVIITDHGQEIAEIVPISRERQTAQSLMASGRLKWKGGKPTGLKGIKLRGKPIAETVIDDRR
ncbi:MAG: type II toxin-antitoxin system Phd/YefM family antitoxin [Thiohalomonadales bacterium]